MWISQVTRVPGNTTVEVDFFLAGGLFTGAEDLKTAEQLEDYGGLENAPLDPCYHKVGGTITDF